HALIQSFFYLISFFFSSSSSLTHLPPLCAGGRRGLRPGGREAGLEPRVPGALGVRAARRARERAGGGAPCRSAGMREAGREPRACGRAARDGLMRMRKPGHGFFKRHWGLIGPEICSAVLEFLNGGDMPQIVNNTVLVLIPKVKNPQDLSQLMPIALCNVLYKICSKVIANRLRLVLGDIISEEQSAFVPGQLITDNVLVAYESIHYLRRKKGVTGACALKLDMAKAYDRVEWIYLRSIMSKLGFSEGFVNLIMKCVESVKFSVRVNGHFSEMFSPNRGIRQGDPISPYLFLLCAEGLSSLLKFSGPNFLAKGIRVGVHAPWVSHLLFADDCLLFTRASARAGRRLMEILQVYQQGSGQMVNIQKSAIFFSDNCQDSAKEEMMQITGIGTEALSEKYLGLPIIRLWAEAQRRPSNIFPQGFVALWADGVRRNSVGRQKRH
ncbi:unnamed protein product, partial [Urochloa humidicola]